MEAIKHPKHYGGDGVYEVFKVAEAWGFWKDAALFNVLKYIARAGKKDPATELQDLKKAQVYLDRKISSLESASKATEAAASEKPKDKIPAPSRKDVEDFMNVLLFCKDTRKGFGTITKGY